MLLNKAETIANKYLELLKPFCKRIEIAGSIRRRKPEVKDIEIVCVRDTKHLYNFCETVNSLRKKKGEPLGKYTQRNLDEGINLDLFMCNLDNWGLIFAIRTGSADFSHLALASGWVKNGYVSEDGYLKKNGSKILVYGEEELFKICGLDYIEPEKREVDVERAGAMGYYKNY